MGSCLGIITATGKATLVNSAAADGKAIPATPPIASIKVDRRFMVNLLRCALSTSVPTLTMLIIGIPILLIMSDFDVTRGFAF